MSDILKSFGDFDVGFKTWGEVCEWQLLDPRLRGPAREVARYMDLVMAKPMIITSIMRTVQENEDADGNPNSGHLLQSDGFVRALDFRSERTGEYPGLSDVEIEKIGHFWSVHFDRGLYWTCALHGDHMHMQVRKRGET